MMDHSKCKNKAMTLRMFKHPQNKQQQTLYLLKLAQTEALPILRQYGDRNFFSPLKNTFPGILNTRLM